MHIIKGSTFIILFLFTGCLTVCCSDSVDIITSPAVIYLNTNATVRCRVVGSANSSLTSLVPFFIINGTYIQHSCIGGSDYLPLTQGFTPRPFIPIANSTLVVELFFSPANLSNDGLSLGCGFYDLNSDTFSMSNLTTLTIRTPNLTQPSTVSGQNTTQFVITLEPVAFVGTQQFYIVVGTVGGVILLVIVCAIVLIVSIIVMVAVSKRKKRATSEPVVMTGLHSHQQDPITISEPMPMKKDGDPSLLRVKEDEDLRNRADSMKTYTESESARYTALPTYSVAVNPNREEFAESMNVTHPTSFSSIEVDEKKEPL